MAHCAKLGTVKNPARHILARREYRTRAIITRGLYTFYPLFEVQNVFQWAFFLKILALCMGQKRFLIKSGL